MKKEKEMANKHITYEKELFTYLKLIEDIKDDEFIGPEVTLVNCYPEFSSYLSQIVNHKLSYLNNNTLYEELQLKFPLLGMSQVWDGEYLNFDRYMENWAAEYLDPSLRFLFIFSALPNEKHFKKFKSAVRSRLESENYRVAIAFSDTPADYIGSLIDTSPLFEWQNIKSTKNG